MTSAGEFTIDGYPVKRYGYDDGKYPTSRRELKLFLLKKYEVCYHCGEKVKDYPVTDGEKIPKNAATIDHLKQRPNRKKGEIVPKVLSCAKCNQSKNTERQKS